MQGGRHPAGVVAEVASREDARVTGNLGAVIQGYHASAAVSRAHRYGLRVHTVQAADATAGGRRLQYRGQVAREIAPRHVRVRVDGCPGVEFEPTKEVLRVLRVRRHSAYWHVQHVSFVVRCVGDAGTGRTAWVHEVNRNTSADAVGRIEHACCDQRPGGSGADDDDAGVGD